MKFLEENPFKISESELIKKKMKVISKNQEKARIEL